MTRSLAEGPLWMQRARYVLAPTLHPCVPLRRFDGRTTDGNASSILVAGTSPTLRLLCAALLPSELVEQPLGWVPLPSLAALLRETARHDLVLARLPRVIADRVAGPPALPCRNW